ncbi:5-hydroxytryptamine receptor 7-like [Argopecten irradians]|uniref:5-hydroxytryptamine receptor 7-like n=1 Tax=Argopecten irradians TaxID=31199 RepID=UPI0037140058
MANSCYIPSNVSDYTDYDTDIAPMWIQVGEIVAGGATVLVNIPAIIAVIFTKLRNPEFRNVHLLILGLTDFLVGLSVFPILITFVNPNSRISHTSCFFRMYIFGLIYFNSLGQVCVICIDRTFLLARPSWRYTTKYVRRYFWMLSSMFLFISSSLSLNFFILGFPKNHIVTCKLENIFCGNFNYFSTAFGGIAIFIECIILICCIIMIVILQRHERKFRTQVGPTYNIDTTAKWVANDRIHLSREHNPENRCQINQQRNRGQESQMNRKISKSTLTTILIIINFFICVTPLNLGSLMQGLQLLETTSRTTKHVLLILSTVNSLINPFIYCFRTPDIRVTMQKGILKCRALFKC